MFPSATEFVQWSASRLGMSAPVGGPVTLVVWEDRLEAPAAGGVRRVRGLFEPGSRRIELFGCAEAGDAELAYVLAHELAHAAGLKEERSAEAAGRRAIEQASPATLRAIADGLRALARPRRVSLPNLLNVDCPLSLG